MARRLISSRVDGPIFHPAQVRALTGTATRQIQTAVAEYALWRVKAYNASDFKHPTGHYRSRLRIVKRGLITVDDSSSVYGPWLEGTGSRNARSRFKGYWHWRRAANDAERQALRIGNEVMARAVRQLGG
jgi:hypothetical protein